MSPFTAPLYIVSRRGTPPHSRPTLPHLTLVLPFFLLYIVPLGRPSPSGTFESPPLLSVSLSQILVTPEPPVLPPQPTRFTSVRTKWRISPPPPPFFFGPENVCNRPTNTSFLVDFSIIRGRPSHSAPPPDVVFSLGGGPIVPFPCRTSPTSPPTPPQSICRRLVFSWPGPSRVPPGRFHFPERMNLTRARQPSFQIRKSGAAEGLPLPSLGGARSSLHRAPFFPLLPNPISSSRPFLWGRTFFGLPSAASPRPQRCAPRLPPPFLPPPPLPRFKNFCVAPDLSLHRAHLASNAPPGRVPKLGLIIYFSPPFFVLSLGVREKDL